MAKPKLQGNSMFEKLSEASQKAVPGLQDDVRKDPSIKNYLASYTSLQIMESASGLQSGAGDLALITKFMNALDPESIVRESEMAMAQNALPALERIQLAIKGLGSDEKLLDDQRDTILAAARKLVEASRGVASNRMDNYKKLGKNMGIPNALFEVDLPGGKEKAQGGQDLSNAKHYNPLKKEYYIPNAPSN